MTCHLYGRWPRRRIGPRAITVMRAEAGTLDAGRNDNGPPTPRRPTYTVVGTRGTPDNATITRARPVAGVLRLRLYPIGAA